VTQTAHRHPELLVALDRGNEESLRVQLRDQLRAAMRERRLAPGARLPSTRALARELGVSRGVVVDAYEQLAAEGYLVGRHGSATRVSAAATGAPAREPLAADAARAPRYDFRPGTPDLSMFPRGLWLAAERRALRAAADADLGYGDPRGAPALRAALAAYLGRVRGVVAEPDRVLVVSGFAQGLSLLGRALREGGARRVAVEDPSHAGARGQLTAGDLEVVPVPVDERGLVVEALTEADAVLTTPAHQFPTGVVLAPERRVELLDRDILVVEDDYDAEYRYDREPVGSLQGLRPERVAYGGSVSKTLAPALRLGWLVLPRGLLDPVVEAKQQDDMGSPLLPQLALTDLLVRGELDRHLRRTRLLYRRRRDALLSAIAEHLPQARPAGVAAGLHVAVYLPGDIDERELAARAAERSVALACIGEHRITPGPPALLLGYARLTEPAIRRGIAELARAFP
jgi:GntR family transcriptional regulator / MocR family aminotransferase